MSEVMLSCNNCSWMSPANPGDLFVVDMELGVCTTHHVYKIDNICPHTGHTVDTCICMIHDPDGFHYRARSTPPNRSNDA